MSNHSLSRAQKIVILRDAQDAGLLHGLTQRQIATSLKWDVATVCRVLKQIAQVNTAEADAFARLEAVQCE